MSRSCAEFVAGMEAAYALGTAPVAWLAFLLWDEFVAVGVAPRRPCDEFRECLADMLAAGYSRDRGRTPNELREWMGAWIDRHEGRAQ